MREVVANAVSGFAKTMGLENLTFPESGIMQFAFQKAGTFYVEDKDEGTALYLLKELSEYELADNLRRALIACHYKESRMFDVQCALHEGSHLVFLIWLHHEQVTIPKVEEVLCHLVTMHEKVINN